MSSLCVVARTPRAVKILKENTEQLLFTKCFMGRTYLGAKYCFVYLPLPLIKWTRFLNIKADAKALAVCLTI